MNILIFGPNGSGKGTQGAIIQKKYSIVHVESGVIFRENIKNGTELGRKAKQFINNGDLVPDEITIPMILDRLKEGDCKDGWLLDGFPRNRAQAQSLSIALEEEGIRLDYVIEIVLDREIAKKRIMGRRICEKDGNHPNNIYIDNIKPARANGDKDVCRVCGANISVRSDDQDEAAINKRHNIYYDEDKGTLAAMQFFKDLSNKNNGIPIIIEVDGRPDVKEVSEKLLSRLE
ncbi:MAG: adenylate kinase [Spirochaetota bacterium]|nr:adenylate kinase [Spirochaetota bacterium]